MIERMGRGEKSRLTFSVCSQVEICRSCQRICRIWTIQEIQLKAGYDCGERDDRAAHAIYKYALPRRREVREAFWSHQEQRRVWWLLVVFKHIDDEDEEEYFKKEFIYFYFWI